MLPLFVQEALPAVVFWTLVVAWALTELRGYRTRRAGTREQDGASLRFIILGVWGGIALGSLVTLTVGGASLPVQVRKPRMRESARTELSRLRRPIKGPSCSTPRRVVIFCETTTRGNSSIRSSLMK